MIIHARTKLGYSENNIAYTKPLKPDGNYSVSTVYFCILNFCTFLTVYSDFRAILKEG